MPDPTKPIKENIKIPIKEHFQLKETIVTIAADYQAPYRSCKRSNSNPQGSS